MHDEKEIFAVLKLDGETHQLQAGGYIIGRNTLDYLHDIPIDHETVDVKHAVLDVRMYGAKIMDVCSKTGTRVDNKAIEKMNFVDLFGSAKLTFGIVSAEIRIVNQIASDILEFNSSRNVSDIVLESPNIITEKKEHELPISRINNRHKKKSWRAKDKFTSDIIVESTQKVRGDDIFANISDENIKRNIEELEEVDDFYVPETQEIFERKSDTMKESQTFIMIPTEEFENEVDGQITSQNLLEDANKFIKLSPLEEINKMRNLNEQFCDSDLDEEMSTLEWNENAKLSINAKVSENQKSGSVTPELDFQSLERSRELSVTPDLEIGAALHNKCTSVTPDLDFAILPTQEFRPNPEKMIVSSKKLKDFTVPRDRNMTSEHNLANKEDNTKFNKSSSISVKEISPQRVPTDYDDLPTQLFVPSENLKLRQSVSNKKMNNFTVLGDRNMTSGSNLANEEENIKFNKSSSISVKEISPQRSTDYYDLPTQLFVPSENLKLRQSVSNKKMNSFTVLGDRKMTSGSNLANEEENIKFNKPSSISIKEISPQHSTDYYDIPTQLFVPNKNFKLRQCVSNKKDMNSTAPQRQNVSPIRKPIENPNASFPSPVISEKKCSPQMFNDYNDLPETSLGIDDLPTQPFIQKSTPTIFKNNRKLKFFNEKPTKSNITEEKTFNNSNISGVKLIEFPAIQKASSKTESSSHFTNLESSDEEDKIKPCGKKIATSDESPRKRRKRFSKNKLFGSSSEDEGDLSSKKIGSEKSNSVKRTNEHKKLPDIKKHHKETLNLNHTNSVNHKPSNVTFENNLNTENYRISGKEKSYDKIHKMLVKNDDKYMKTSNRTTVKRSSDGYKTERKMSKNTKTEKRETPSSESSSTDRSHKKTDKTTKSKVAIKPTECFSYRTRSQKRANSRSGDDCSTANTIQEQNTGKRSSSRTTSKKQEIFEIDMFRQTTKIKLARCDASKESSREKGYRNRKIIKS